MSITMYKRADPYVEGIIFWPNNIPDIMAWLGPDFRGVINVAAGDFKSATNAFPNIDILPEMREKIKAGEQFNVLIIADRDGFKGIYEGQYIVRDPVLGYIPTAREDMGKFYTICGDTETAIDVITV